MREAIVITTLFSLLIMIKRKILYTLSLFIIAMSQVGCVHDNDPIPDTPAPGEVSFSLNVPGLNLPATRSYTGYHESIIDHVDVYIFDATTPGLETETFLKRITVKPEDISQSTNADEKYKVNFKLRTEEMKNVRLVFFINSPVDERVLADLGLTTSTTLKHFLYRTLGDMTFHPNVGSWPFEKGYYMKMYGHTDVLNLANGKKISGIELIRCTARIDVINFTDDFVLSKVHLVNYNTNYRLAPNVNPDFTIDFSTIVPPASTHRKVVGWDKRMTWDYEENGLIGKIYPMEAYAAQDGSLNDRDRKEAVCLVLEGQYQGETYFYRVDFTDVRYQHEGQTEYIPLVRNHKYIVSLEEVSGVGYKSGEEALNAYTVPSNLKSRMLQYNEGNLTHVEYNGQYMLGVENKELVCTRDAQVLPVILYTDYPEGIACEVENGDASASWLKIAATRQPATWENTVHFSKTGKVTLYLKTDANNTGTSREASIKFTAGRLSFTMNVEQTNRELFFINIYDENGNEINELRFDYGLGLPQITAKKIFVRWNKGVPCTVRQEGSGNFRYTLFSDVPGNGSTEVLDSGNEVFLIQPQVYLPSEVSQTPYRMSTIKFSVNDPQGLLLEKIITLIQGNK